MWLVAESMTRIRFLRKISTQLIAISLLFSVFSISVVGLFFLLASSKVLKDEIGVRNREIVRQAAVQISEYVRDSVRQLRVVADLVGTFHSDIKAQEIILVGFAGATARYNSISFFDASGTLRATSTPNARRIPEVDSHTLSRILMRRDPELSSVYLSVDSLPLMMVTIAVRDGQGVSGVIVPEVSLRDIWNLVDQIVVGKRGYAFVTSSDGVLIAHPDKTIVLKGAEATAEWAGGSQGPEIYVQRRSPGNHAAILAALAPVYGTDWTVVLQQPLSEAFLPVRMIFIFTAAPLFFVFFLLILRYTYLKKRVITPLGRLVDYAQAVREGNTDATVPVSSDDELGLLTSALSGMVAQLKERTRSLERSEHEYKLVTDGVGEIIFALDGSGCFAFLNRRMEEITGHQIGDLLGNLSCRL